MKLKEFIKNLDKFVKENPKALDLDVVTSIDDEWNWYNRIYYEPSVGILDDLDFMESKVECANSVCIN